MAHPLNRPAVSLIAVVASFGAAAQVADAGEPIVNPAIDPVGFLRVAGAALAERERRRISEAEFEHMRREPETIVLHARSKKEYDELHVEGALHLSFPDIAIVSLAALLPDRTSAS
ncbi:MAG: hypothetical protein JO090_15110 [Rhizobacter sp.]|nr:hypothetical protein [Rhizobacter sp.]